DNMKTYRMLIGGQWVDAVSGKTFDDMNPFNGELYAKVPEADARDVDRVMAAAYEARSQWASAPAPVRSQFLLKAAQVLEASRQEFAEVLTLEGGGTFGKVMFEISQTVDMLETAAADARYVVGETYSNDPTKISMTLRKPRGTIVAISPWNFPLVLSMYKISYGLATGNTVVLKPASDTPVIGLKIGELFEKAGLPAGVFNVITGPGSVLGKALIDDRRCSFVAITGQTVTGREVARRAAENLKECTLELGGKNPIIILADADLDYAVKSVVFSAFLHQGEICMSADRIIVERPIVEEFTKAFVGFTAHLPVGDPSLPTTFIGPIINDAQVQVIDAHVKDAVAKGATVLTGGSYQGRLYQPTVLSGITPAMRIYYEETFGPVASIIPVSDEKEALAVANDTAYGLSAGVITKDLEKALFLAEGLDVGMVHVNDGSIDADACCPFGGCKESGQGREGGRYAVEKLTDLKWVTIQKTKRQLPF
ncbi:MAG: aldehyde dehydrogenase family protein, partial [Syntrophorhabdales bacterium]